MTTPTADQQDSAQHEIAEVEAMPRHAHDRGDGIVQEFTEPTVVLPSVKAPQTFQSEPQAV